MSDTMPSDEARSDSDESEEGATSESSDDTGSDDEGSSDDGGDDDKGSDDKGSDDNGSDDNGSSDDAGDDGPDRPSDAQLEKVAGSDPPDPKKLDEVEEKIGQARAKAEEVVATEDEPLYPESGEDESEDDQAITPPG